MREKIKGNLGYLVKKYPEVYEAYQAYGKSVHACGPLDDRTKALLKVAISSVAEHDYALTTHLKKAVDLGITQEELEQVLLLTAPSVGFPNMMESLLTLRAFFDEEE